MSEHRFAPVAAGEATRLRPAMTQRIAAGRELERPASAPGGAQLRVAVLDTDSGFLQVLGKRLERLGWEHRVLASPVPIDTVVAMRLNAFVIDLSVLGPQAWDYLEKLCSSLPGLGVDWPLGDAGLLVVLAVWLVVSQAMVRALSTAPRRAGESRAVA